MFYGKNAEMWAETGIPKCDVCAEQQCDFGKPCQVRAVLLVAHNECIWVVYFKERSEKTLNLNCSKKLETLIDTLKVYSIFKSF